MAERDERKGSRILCSVKLSFENESTMAFGKDGMIWENVTETCILSYVKWIASPGSMHETGCSGLVHWDDPEGWDGERGGRGVQDGDTCTPMADSCE